MSLTWIPEEIDLCRLLSPLCRQIDSPRDQISDAVAVYFVMPTPQNVSRMCEDCRAQLYDKYYLNFVTAIPRPLLEELAKTSLETNCVSQIAKVRECYQLVVPLALLVHYCASFFFHARRCMTNT